MLAQFRALQNPFCRRVISLVALLFLGAGLRAGASSAPDGAKIKVIWGAQGPVRELLSFSKGLAAVKQGSSREQDPATGTVVRWNGVLLQSVIERSLKDVPLESKARVDLIVLRNAAGAEALIPRSLVTKYPVLLANAREGTALAGWQSVIPWSTRPKVRDEQLPLESYFVQGVTEVELANFRERFTPFLLKRRTDPSALRGENLFLRNCVSCHSGASKVLSEIVSEAKARSLASGHPVIRGFTPLTARDQRAIQTYFQSIRAEKAQAPATPDQVAQH